MDNPSVILFFYSYLSDRSQYVCVSGKLPAVGPMQTGAPQGSILVPLLFCIFITDLPLYIQDQKVRNSLFADDSFLNKSGKTLKETDVRLQKSITEVSDWCKNNHLCPDLEKNQMYGDYYETEAPTISPVSQT